MSFSRAFAFNVNDDDIEIYENKIKMKAEMKIQQQFESTQHKQEGNFNYIECLFIMFLLGYPVVNDPLYNHEVFGPSKGKGGDIGGKSDEQLVKDLINIHNAENWLGIDGDSELSMFNSKSMGSDLDDSLVGVATKGKLAFDQPYLLTSHTQNTK